jgi:hypothetical protein
MPDSLVDRIMRQTAIPALLTQFGIPATHVNRDGDETVVTVILGTELAAVGDYGERMEPRTTLQLPTTSGAQVGDQFHIAGDVTDDDPFPDDGVWSAVQLIADDGYFRTFAVRSGA